MTPGHDTARCPRCEGCEATYHTFEGGCSLATRAEDDVPHAARPTDELAARRKPEVRP